MNNGTVLYLREVNKFLALVCILREENFDKQGLIDYNFQCFHDAIQDVFELKFNKLKPQQSPNSELIYNMNDSLDSTQSNGYLDHD